MPQVELTTPENIVIRTLVDDDGKPLMTAVSTLSDLDVCQR